MTRQSGQAEGGFAAVPTTSVRHLRRMVEHGGIPASLPDGDRTVALSSEPSRSRLRSRGNDRRVRSLASSRAAVLHHSSLTPPVNLLVTAQRDLGWARLLNSPPARAAAGSPARFALWLAAARTGQVRSRGGDRVACLTAHRPLVEGLRERPSPRHVRCLLGRERADGAPRNG
jgi:hypothetical protein